MTQESSGGVLLSFADFSDEVFFTCLQNLQGAREAARLASVSRAWAEMLGPGSGPMWKTFGAQEFGNSNLQAPPAPKDKALVATDFTGVDRYASLARAASLRRALWGRVPTRGLGQREGTPWMFLSRSGEELFCYSGVDRYNRPLNELHVAGIAPLKELLSTSSAGVVTPTANSTSAPADEGQSAETLLEFCEVMPKGHPPRPSYCATVTPLVDDEVPGCEWFDLEDVRGCMQDGANLLPPKGAEPTLFVVTGGCLRPLFQDESPDWALGIIRHDGAAGAPEPAKERAFLNRAMGSSGGFSPPSRISDAGKALPREAIWVRPGPCAAAGPDERRSPPNEPRPRVSAAAVYVPARFAESGRYPKGYLMLFGGNVDREATNTLDVLDLATWTWTWHEDLPNAPAPRNAHSAVLMPDEEEPATKAKVLIFGGGNGVHVPRDGREMVDFATFDPRSMSWLGPAVVPRREEGVETERQRSLVPGRAHAVVKIARSVVFFGGGFPPVNRLTAMPCQQLSERHARRIAAREGDREGDLDAAWGALLRSLKWRHVLPCSGHPISRAFHSAVSLAPAGLPMLIMYGGWDARRGTLGDVWAAKIDPWVEDAQEESSGSVRARAVAADRRFKQGLNVPDAEEESDEDLEGMMVNVGGRIMPLQMLAQIMRMQLGEQEGTRRLRELLRASRQAEEEEDDEDEEEAQEDEDEEAEEADAQNELTFGAL